MSRVKSTIINELLQYFTRSTSDNFVIKSSLKYIYLQYSKINSRLILRELYKQYLILSSLFNTENLLDQQWKFI